MKRDNILAASKLVIILSTLIFSSCVTQKNLEYIQDEDTGIKTFSEAKIDDYKLKPNDELYIQINSLDDATAGIFSNSGSQQSSSLANMQPYGASLASYSIDKEGFVMLPVIGNIFVKNKTISEVSELLKDSLSNILSQPLVTVKLVNRYISILGEVRNPGHFPYAQEKLSIFDALGYAGDITDFGNRNEVILMRNENGKNIRISLDLTTSNILASNYYYLRPNDVIYVKPLKKKFWGMKEFPFSIVLSSVSTVLSSISTAVLLYTVFSK